MEPSDINEFSIFKIDGCEKSHIFDFCSLYQLNILLRFPDRVVPIDAQLTVVQVEKCRTQGSIVIRKCRVTINRIIAIGLITQQSQHMAGINGKCRPSKNHATFQSLST
jgi:hypothetical protein